MTKRAPYIPFYPSDWLAGVADLSPAECGVYVNLLMLIYDTGAPVKADFGRLSRRFNCPLSTLRATVISLCAAGKLVMEDGFISNERAERELSKRSDKSEKARQSVNIREQKKQKYRGQNPVCASSSALDGSQDLPIKSKGECDRTINGRLSNQNQNQNITPKPPLKPDPETPAGGGVNASDVDAVWKLASNAGRQRSSKSKTGIQLRKLVKAGIPISRILLAVSAYYSDCQRTGLGHMAIDRFLGDRITTWLEEVPDKPADPVFVAKGLIQERERNGGRWLPAWTRETGITEDEAERLAA